MLRLPRSRTDVLTLLAALALVAGCGGEAQPVLSVAGVGYSEAELLGLSEERRQRLAELTVFGVAVADSALGTLGAPLIEQAERDRLYALSMASRALDSAGVGDDVLRARYLTQPEFELTVRHLLVFSARYETDGTRALAREKAERARERVRSGEPFGSVAAEVSDEPGAVSRQGLLQPGRRGSWVAEFWGAALALEPGEVSPVVETQYGFHVLRLEDRTLVPFEEARTRVLLDVARMLIDLDGSSRDAPLPDGTVIEGEPSGTGGGSAEGVIATWEGGALTAAAYARALAAEESALRNAVTRGEAGAVRAAAERAVRAAAAAERARSSGLEVGAAWRSEATREWTDRAEAWGTLLGFRPGLSREAVRQAALAALGATGQNAGLAREALVREAGGLLAHALAVETAGGPGA